MIKGEDCSFTKHMQIKSRLIIRRNLSRYQSSCPSFFENQKDPFRVSISSFLRHRGFTRAPSQPALDKPSPPDRKPRSFNKRIILWGAEKCSRNVTAVRYDRRARRAERVVRSFVGIGAVCNFGGPERIPRTPERGTGYQPGYFRQPTCQLAYKLTPHLPPGQLGFTL